MTKEEGRGAAWRGVDDDDAEQTRIWGGLCWVGRVAWLVQDRAGQEGAHRTSNLVQ